MKIQTVAIVLTVFNLFLLVVLLAEFRPAFAQQKNVLPILRGRGLEIVDSLGKLRATITLQSATVKDGVVYPGGPILRLITSEGKPVVKIGGPEDGGAISLAEPSNGYIQIISRPTGGFIRVKNADGKEQVMKP